MPKTIAIVAPMFDEKQYHMDFNLRLKQDNRELNLAVLYELAKKEYQPKMLGRQENTHAETIPSAGISGNLFPPKSKRCRSFCNLHILNNDNR